MTDACSATSLPSIALVVYYDGLESGGSKETIGTRHSQPDAKIRRNDPHGTSYSPDSFMRDCTTARLISFTRYMIETHTHHAGRSLLAVDRSHPVPSQPQRNITYVLLWVCTDLVTMTHDVSNDAESLAQCLITTEWNLCICGPHVTLEHCHSPPLDRRVRGIRATQPGLDSMTTFLRRIRSSCSSRGISQDTSLLATLSRSAPYV